MHRVLVSSCLVGDPVRYDGSSATRASAIIDRWKAEGRLVLACPEILGGLPVPRPPAEIAGGDGAAVLRESARVVDIHGSVVTPQFMQGANLALKAALDAGVRVAVLKEASPSCGSSYVYDGTFRHQRVAGQGVTAALLSAAGIRVFSDTQLDEAVSWVQKLEEEAP